MPKNYEYILREFLKGKRMHSNNDLIEIDKGVPRGGVISPLLSN